MALVMGWINQALTLAISGAGINGGEFTPYYVSSYYLTAAGLVLFLLGLLVSQKDHASEARKSGTQMMLSAVLFLGAIFVMFSDVSLKDGLKEAAKDAYVIIAIRAALVFAGLFLFRKALNKTVFTGKAALLVVSRIMLLLVMLSALLLFIPMFGDILFGFAFFIFGFVLFVCFFLMIMSK